MESMQGIIQSRTSVLMARVQELLSAPVRRLDDVVQESRPDAEVEGVYLISSPGHPEDLVYAGRTKSKTVRGRLKDHRNLPTPSDLRGMLPRWPDYPQVVNDYGVRWLPVAEPVERAYLECFTIAVVQPKFNRP
jgi:hypothetical protein